MSLLYQSDKVYIMDATVITRAFAERFVTVSVPLPRAARAAGPRRGDVWGPDPEKRDAHEMPESGFSITN